MGDKLLIFRTLQQNKEYKVCHVRSSTKFPKFQQKIATISFLCFNTLLISIVVNEIDRQRRDSGYEAKRLGL